MARVFPYIFLLLLIAAIAYFFITQVVAPPLRRAAAKRAAEKQRHAVWHADEIEYDGATQVIITNGLTPLKIGDPVPISLPHWDYQEALDERYIEAEDKAVTKNRWLNA